jgi:ABC-type transporter Mla subunit MlaD
VGKVSKINLTTDNKIKVDLYFYKKYAYLIRQDSVLKVQSSLLGSSSLILITGDGIESELLEPKSLIYSSDMPEGQAVLKIYEVSGGSGEEITDKVKIILDDIHNLAPSINSTLTSLTGTMDHVSTLVSGIEKRKEIEQMTELLRSTLSELRVLIATVKKAFGK